MMPSKLDFSRGRLRAFKKREPGAAPVAATPVEAIEGVAFAHGEEWNEETAKAVRNVLVRRLPSGFIKLYEYPPR